MIPGCDWRGTVLTAAPMEVEKGGLPLGTVNDEILYDPTALVIWKKYIRSRLGRIHLAVGETVFATAVSVFLGQCLSSRVLSQRIRELWSCKWPRRLSNHSHFGSKSEPVLLARVEAFGVSYELGAILILSSVSFVRPPLQHQGFHPP